MRCAGNIGFEGLSSVVRRLGSGPECIGSIVMSATSKVQSGCQACDGTIGIGRLHVVAFQAIALLESASTSFLSKFSISMHFMESLSRLTVMSRTT